MKQPQKNKRGGFSLAELLIVIAIVAVLVAISIPIFTKNIEKAKEAYDIATMRQAASAAIDMYYAGLNNEATAKASGFSWWGDEGAGNSNAYGAYDPRTGKFYDNKNKITAYGKGTKVDGGMKFTWGKDREAYASNEDYRDAVVMVSIYPYQSKPYADVYWKNNTGKYNNKNNQYVGGAHNTSDPNYSIRIYFN